MPSDPLPLSPETRELLVPPSPLSEAWDAMLDDLEENAITPGGWKKDEPDNIVMTHRPRIEQEARTLARAEVIAELRAEVEDRKALPPLLNGALIHGFDPFKEGRDLVARSAVLAALSRLGERE